MILTGAALRGANVETSLLLLAYAAGSAVSLGAALLLGGSVFASMKRSLYGYWSVSVGIHPGILPRDRKPPADVDDETDPVVQLALDLARQMKIRASSFATWNEPSGTPFVVYDDIYPANATSTDPGFTNDPKPRSQTRIGKLGYVSQFNKKITGTGGLFKLEGPKRFPAPTFDDRTAIKGWARKPADDIIIMKMTIN